MRALPPITKNLLVINILMFLAYIVAQQSGVDLNDLLGLHFFKSKSFHLYQLVSYMFMHANLQHIFFNMLALWMFGRIMEQAWGPKRYLIFYMVCGLGAGLCQELVQYLQYVGEGLANYQYVDFGGGMRLTMEQYLAQWTTVGASGAIYGILLGFGLTYPNATIFLLIPPLPLKAKWLVIGYAVIELWAGLTSAGSNVAHFAHLGGMIFGFALILYWRHKDGLTRNGFTTWKEYKPNHRMHDSFWGSGDWFGNGKKSFWRKRATENEDRDIGPDPHYSGSDGSGRNRSAQSSGANTDPAEQRRARQAEIDRILDKVRHSGYSCLTDQEKKTLFDFRNK